MKLIEYLDVIESFLKEYLSESHMNKYILGLSGGVDSSLCAVLASKAVGNEKLKCIMIPIESNPNDLKDAISLANQFSLNYQIIDATQTYKTYLDDFANAGINLSRDTLSNLKARIRMSILYAVAQQEKGLVIGTDNKDERFTGYFTKFGDGACDILPIAHLLKSEVVEASKLLGIPTYLAERVPTAGLFENQTDETEMGVTYKDLDAYLKGQKVDQDIEKRILYLNRISEHKRNPIPCPKDFNGE